MRRDIESIKTACEEVIKHAENIGTAVFDSFHLFNYPDAKKVVMRFSFVYSNDMDTFVSALQRNHLGDLIQKRGLHGLDVMVSEAR